MRLVHEKLLRLLRPLPAGRAPGARRFLAPALGVGEFFVRLEASGARYAVLRWFDRLPEVDPGEDIDLLIADDDVEIAGALLCNQPEPGAIPVDLRSVSGLPGSAWHEMAYYPPYLAEQILDRAVLHKGLYRVPCPEDHLLSLAYHALYHKGSRSGLPTNTPDVAALQTPEHDYAAVLEGLAAQLAVDVPITMEGLDELLNCRGWRPPFDALDRLALHNDWIEKRHLAHVKTSPPEECGLTVFIIRQQAVHDGREDYLLRLLANRGFDILLSRRLEPDDAARCARGIRGGNWGRGPYPVSGGGPALVVAACDLSPWPVRPDVLERQPRLDNGRVFDVKRLVRKLYNETRPAELRCNVLHSSDHDAQAWEYVRIALPGHEQELRRQIRAMHACFKTPVPVTRSLTSFGRRAKVELIEHQGAPAVRKTFRPASRKYLEREIETTRRFGGVMPEIPPLLECGDNYLVVPYYEDVLWTRPPRRLLPPRLLPLRIVRQVVEVLRRLHEQGYALIDCTPDNLIVDRTRGLKLIDFEYAHQYEAHPPDFADCYSLKGVPEGFSEELPILGRHVFAPYEHKWRSHVGLSLKSLLQDPAWKQHLHRLLYQCGQFRHVMRRHIGRRARRLAQRLRAAQSSLFSPAVHQRPS